MADREGAARVMDVPALLSTLRERLVWIGPDDPRGQTLHEFLPQIDALEQQGKGPRADVMACVAASLRDVRPVALGVPWEPQDVLLPDDPCEAGRAVEPLCTHAVQLLQSASKAMEKILDKPNSGSRYMVRGDRGRLLSIAEVLGHSAIHPDYLKWLLEWVVPLGRRHQAMLRNLLRESERVTRLAQAEPQGDNSSTHESTPHPAHARFAASSTMSLEDELNRLPKIVATAYQNRPGPQANWVWRSCDMPLPAVWPIPRQLAGTERSDSWLEEADALDALAKQLEPPFAWAEPHSGVDEHQRRELEGEWQTVLSASIGLRSVAMALRLLAGARRPFRCDCCHRFIAPRSRQLRRCALHASGAHNRADMLRVAAYTTVRAELEARLSNTPECDSALAVLENGWRPLGVSAFACGLGRSVTPRQVHQAAIGQLNQLVDALARVMDLSVEGGVESIRGEGGPLPMLPSVSLRELAHRVSKNADAALQDLAGVADMPLRIPMDDLAWGRSLRWCLPRPFLGLFLGGGQAFGLEGKGLADLPGADPDHPLVRWLHGLPSFDARRMEGALQEVASPASHVEDALPSDVLRDLIRLSAWHRAGGAVVDEAIASRQQVPHRLPRGRLDAHQAALMHERGDATRQIAEHFGVSVQAVTMALQRRRKAERTAVMVGSQARRLPEAAHPASLAEALNELSRLARAASELARRSAAADDAELQQKIQGIRRIADALGQRGS